MHSLSLFTSSLMSGLLPSGNRFRSSSGNSSGGGNANSNSASVDTMSLFSTDYPVLPGSIRTERIISYLNKLTDPMKDVVVIMKQKECGSSGNTKSKKGHGLGSNRGDGSGNDRKRKFMGSSSMAKRRNKRKARNGDDEKTNPASAPMGLESVLMRSGKRRRLDLASSIADIRASSSSVSRILTSSAATNTVLRNKTKWSINKRKYLFQLQEQFYML